MKIQQHGILVLHILEQHNVVRKFRFVNDAAECGVKLGLDFLDTAKKETRFQKLFEVDGTKCSGLRL